MAYTLVWGAAMIFIVGVTRVSRSRSPHATPWPSLLLWAFLFMATLATWLSATYAG